MLSSQPKKWPRLAASFPKATSLFAEEMECSRYHVMMSAAGLPNMKAAANVPTKCLTLLLPSLNSVLNPYHRNRQTLER